MKGFEISIFNKWLHPCKRQNSFGASPLPVDSHTFLRSFVDDHDGVADAL